MIRLVYSNRTEELLSALGEDLQGFRRRPGASVFETVQLVVPNRHVDAHVRADLAARAGISFNIATHLLHELLPDLLAPLTPRMRMLDQSALRGLLLSALLEPRERGDDLAPVLDYIHGKGHRDDAADLRKFQLATELSSVFLEYAYGRPEVLDGWREGRLSFHDTPYAQDERWQRALWLEVFGPGGVLSRRAEETGERWVTLSDLLDPSSPVGVRSLKLPDRFHFFGFSHMGRSFHRLFAALAERAQVFIYTLNPCEEFWEDIAGPSLRSSGAASQRTLDEADPYGLEKEGDTPLLRLWGRPGRENIRLLNELSQCDFEPRFADPLEAGPTLLRQLQHDILHRNPERPRPAAGPSPFAGDRSLRVLACPGVRRECEIVANEIWRLLREDPSLRFSDVAVVVSPREAGRYLPQLASAFGECGDIPFTVLDLPTSGESRALEAVEMLLALPFGTFGRQDLLRLCTHPVVAARFPDDNPADWVAWSDALGIVHGADRADHRETYITRDILNWEQGVRRLALGAFMTGERSGDGRAFHAAGEDYLPEEHTQASQLSAGRFALLVRSLTADARFARSSRRPLGEWVRFFRLLINCYLAPSTDREEKELLGCVEALEAIDDQSTGESEVPYRVAYQLALSALAELRSRRGVYPSEGVAVSSFANLRGLPFRVVFVTGLGEGRFPEVERKNPLDLRMARQKPGDLGQREQDKYAFLETALGARDRLYLSYVARDPVTGEDLQPSSVVLDLVEVLERGYLPPDELRELVERHPLRRFDPLYHPDLFALPTSPFASVLPEARREAQALALGQHLRAHLGRSGTIEPRAFARVNPAAWAQLSPLLRLFDLPPEPEAEPSQAVRVSASSLRRFLECPMQGHAAYALGLADVEEDALAIEDEPFATSPLRTAYHLRSWLTESLVRGAELLDLYDREMALLERRGQAPTGVFAEVEREAHRACLRAWESAAHPLVLQDGGAHVLRFGAADEHGYVDRPLDPIALELVLSGARPRALRVEITGTTSALLERSRASLVFSPRPLDTSDEGLMRQQKLLLRAFFDHALISASERLPHRPHAAHLIFADGQRTTATFAPFESTAQARAYLAALAADLLGQAHAYLLPCEAVFAHKVKGEAITDAIERVRKLPSYSSRFGPVPRVDHLPAPPEEEALSMVERRFGPFFLRSGG